MKPNHRDPRCSVQRTGTAHQEVPRGLPRRTRWSRWAAGLGDTAPSSQGQLCRGCWSEPCRGAEQEQTARPRGFCPPTAAGMQRRLCSPSTPSEGKGKTSSHGFQEAHTSPTANFSQGPGGQSGETGGRSVSREQATGLPRPSPPAHRQDDSAESQQGLVLHTPHHRDADSCSQRKSYCDLPSSDLGKQQDNMTSTKKQTNKQVLPHFNCWSHTVLNLHVANPVHYNCKD